MMPSERWAAAGPPALGGAGATFASVDGVLAGIAASWRRHGLLFAAAWLATLALAALAVWLGGGLYFFLDYRDGGGRWAGLFTVFSAGCFVAAGFGLLLVARFLPRRGRGRARRAWALAGGLALLLGFDDLVQFHESAARWLGRRGVPPPFGLGDQDLYVFAVYGLLAWWAARGMWPQLARWSGGWIPAAAMVACFAASTAIDMIPWSSLTRLEQRVWGPLEEIAKTLGCVNLALFATLAVDAAARELGGRRSAAPAAPASASAAVPRVAAP